MSQIVRTIASAANTVADVVEVVEGGLKSFGLMDPEVENREFPETDRIGSTVAPNVTLVGQSQVEESIFYTPGVSLRDSSSSVVSEIGQLNIQRFLPLDEVDWTGSTTAGVDLKTWVFPKTLLDLHPIKGLINYFSYVHTEMEFKVQLNPGPTAAGILVVLFVPADCNYDFHTFRNFPHVMLNCSVNTSAVLRVPYFAETQYRKKGDAKGQGTLHVVPLTKFRSSTGGISTVPVSIFARLVDPKFQCVVVPQGVEDPVRIQEGFSAMYLGNSRTTQSVKMSVIGETPQADLATVSGSVITDFIDICRIPSYIGQFEWTASSPKSTALFAIDVKNSGMEKTSSIKDKSNLGSVGRFFMLYSGDITITFQIAASKMNQGRLVAVFYPDSSTSFTFAQATNAITLVMDIGLNSTFEMTLPYVNTQPYRPSGAVHGRLEVFPRTTLATNAASPSSVDVAMYVSAAKNFEYSVPMMQNYNFATYQGYEKNVLALSGDVETNPGPDPVGTMENVGGTMPVAEQTFANMTQEQPSALVSHTNVAALGGRAMYLGSYNVKCTGSPTPGDGKKVELKLSTSSFYNLFRTMRYRTGDLNLHITNRNTKYMYVAHSYYSVDLEKMSTALAFSTVLSMGAVAIQPAVPFSLRVPYYYMDPQVSSERFGYLYVWTHASIDFMIDVSVSFPDNVHFSFLQSPMAASTPSQTKVGAVASGHVPDGGIRYELDITDVSFEVPRALSDRDAAFEGKPRKPVVFEPANEDYMDMATCAGSRAVVSQHCQLDVGASNVNSTTWFDKTVVSSDDDVSDKGGGCCSGWAKALQTKPTGNTNWSGLLNEMCRRLNYPYPVCRIWTDEPGFKAGIYVGNLLQIESNSRKKEARADAAEALYLRIQKGEVPHDKPWSIIDQVCFAEFFTLLEKLGFSKPVETKMSSRVGKNTLRWDFLGQSSIVIAESLSDCRKALTTNIISKLNANADHTDITACGDVEKNPGPVGLVATNVRFGNPNPSLVRKYVEVNGHVGVNIGKYIFLQRGDILSEYVDDVPVKLTIIEDVGYRVLDVITPSFCNKTEMLADKLKDLFSKFDLRDECSCPLFFDDKHLRYISMLLMYYEVYNSAEDQGVVDAIAGTESGTTASALQFLAKAPELFNRAMKGVTESVTCKIVKLIMRAILCSIILTQSTSAATMVSVGSIMALDALDFVTNTQEAVTEVLQQVTESSEAPEEEKKGFMMSIADSMRYYFWASKTKDSEDAQPHSATDGFKDFNTVTASAKNADWWFQTFKKFVDYLCSRFDPSKVDMAVRILDESQDEIIETISGVNELSEINVSKGGISNNHREKWLNLSSSINKYLAIASRVPGNKHQFVLSQCRKSLDSMAVMPERSKDPMRVDPLAIHFYGPPGQGKSILCSRVGNLISQQIDSTGPYYQPKKSDFMDGYEGNKVHVWEEALGDRMEADAAMILDFVSSQHVIVPMAHLVTKGTMYNCSVMLTTGNDILGSEIALKCPQAIERRFKNFKVRAKDKYITEDDKGLKLFDLSKSVKDNSLKNGACWEISVDDTDWVTFDLMAFVASVIDEANKKQANHEAMVAMYRDDSDMYNDYMLTHKVVPLKEFVSERTKARDRSASMTDFNHLKAKAKSKSRKSGARGQNEVKVWLAKNVWTGDPGDESSDGQGFSFDFTTPQGFNDSYMDSDDEDEDIGRDNIRYSDAVIEDEIGRLESRRLLGDLPMNQNPRNTDGTFVEKIKNVWTTVKSTKSYSWLCMIASALQSIATVLAIGLAIKVWFEKPSEPEAGRAYSGNNSVVLLDRKSVVKPKDGVEATGGYPSYAHLMSSCVNIVWGSGHTQLGVAIGPNRILTTRHNLGSYGDEECLTLQTADAKSIKLSKSECNWYSTTDVLARQTDVAELVFDRNLGVLFKDKSKHVANVEEGGIGKILLFRSIDGNSTVEVRDLTKFRDVERTHFSGLQLHGDMFGQIEYAGRTEPGDCGGMVIQLQRGTWKIVAIHNGRHRLPRCGTHFSVGYSLQKLDLVQGISEGEITSVKECERSHVQSKSRIFPSPFYEAFDVIKEPSVQSPRDSRMLVVRESIVKENNAAKYSNNLYEPNKQVEQLAMNEVVKNLSQVTGMCGATTIEDAILGGDTNHIDMTTSAGYKYTKINVKKKDLFTINLDNTATITPEFSREVDQIIQKSRDGVKIDTTFCSAVKDELLKREKIETGTSRVIESCEVDYVVAYRMLMQNIYAGIYNSSCVETGVAVGIDPILDSHSLVQHLSKFSHYASLDFKKFDGTLSEGIMRLGVEVLAALHNEPDAVRVMHEPVINSTIVVLDEVWSVKGGMPSGAPCTSILNTICNLLMLKMVFLEIGLSFDDFTTICYGDDAIIAYNGNIEDFDEKLPALLKKYFGMTVQPASKEGSRYQVQFDEVEFLKRKFVYVDDYHIYVARLDIATIEQSLMWQTSREFFLDKVYSLAMELVPYGVDVYNRVRFKCLNRSVTEHFPTYSVMEMAYKRLLDI